MVYFIADIRMGAEKPQLYQRYIDKVKPIVESWGGVYLARTDQVTSLSECWKPDRIIIIQWESRTQMENCFNSRAYREIAAFRENTVDSRAIIVEV